MNFDRTIFPARCRIVLRLLAGGALLLLAGNPGGVAAGSSHFQFCSRAELLMPTAVLLLLLAAVYVLGALRNGRCGLSAALFLLACYAVTPSVRTPSPDWLLIGAEVFPALLLGRSLSPQDRRRRFRLDKLVKPALRFCPALLFLLTALWWGAALYAAPELRALPLLIPAILLALPTLLAWRIDHAVKASRRLPLLAVMNVVVLGVLRLAVVEPALELLEA